MTTLTLKSDEARQQWRDILDKARMGARVVIERYARPDAVIVGYEQFNALLQRIQELEAWQEAQRIKQNIDSGSEQVVTFEQHKARMGNLYDLDTRIQPGS